MWLNGEISKPSLVRGIDPVKEAEIATIQKHMKVGTLDLLQPGTWGVNLGVDLAKNLSVRDGEKVALVSTQMTVTPAGSVPCLQEATGARHAVADGRKG